MKFVNQSAELIQQKEGIQGIFDIIAECAATCYKSTPKTGESAKEFVDKLIKNGHTAMLEFGTVYYTIPRKDIERCDELQDWKYDWDGSPYIDYDCDGNYFYVTTNLRYVMESYMWAENMEKYIVEPTEYHPKRVCVRIITSIGIARELTRHRVFSFAQESTRYCNYSTDKFGGELTFITPDKEAWGGCTDAYVKQINILTDVENCYLTAIQHGVSPQVTRNILLLSTKTEICMCGFVDDWKRFMDLRLRGTTGAPHPEIKILAEQINELIK